MDQEQHTINVLLALTKTLVEGLSLDDALQAVTDAAIKLLPCEHSSVRVLDHAQGKLLCGARSGKGAHDGPMSLRVGVGIGGWVAQHGEPVRIDDVSHDTRFEAASNQGFVIRSILSVPLLSAGQVVGVLGVTSPNTHAFSADDETLATLLANCAVPAIETARLERLRQQAEQLAVTDAHTMAFNQRYLFPRLREEIDRACRQPRQLSVLLLDLDNFKEINDQLGHAAGDAVLRCFAERVFSCVRSGDILVRRGGDEFVLIMPDTDGERAVDAAERVRAAVADAEFDVGDTTVATTASIGVATWRFGESADEIERRADFAMYRAKRRGRNRVERAD